MTGARCYRLDADGVVVSFRLTPKASRDAIDGIGVLSDGRPVAVARVRAVPADGAANAALVGLVAKSLKVRKSAVTVISGSRPAFGGNRRMANHRLILSLVLVTGLGAPAMAADNASAYSQIILDQCAPEPSAADEPLEGGTWWCEGYGGMPVRVAEGDLRFLVSYGANAAAEIAAGQTVPQFNTINETLEWRLDGAGYPFATILRFFTDGDGQKGQVLVITKLGGPGQICHIGYVDAVANPNANTLARQIADQTASGFACGRDTPLNF